ncbi:MAG: hypothetical protein ACYDEV_10705 [Acidiferrobacter sp.]
MKTDYDAEGDILILHFTGKPVICEMSQDRHLNISDTEDGASLRL